MRKYVVFFLSIVMLLSACAQGTPSGSGSASGMLSWQEQYDLGIRYLSEGNYQEAIIAFTAAIEIDPKRAPAYVGRGDSHSGVAKLAAGDAAELPEQAVNSYESAIADYLAAIDLDALTSEVYLKAADAYLALGDIESAIDILTRGFEATDDEKLADKIAEIESDQPQSGGNGTITFSGNGRDMSMSLTYPDLPDEVLVLGDHDSYDAHFFISCSDGNQTFGVWTGVYDNDNGGNAYMTAIPDSSVCRTHLGIAVYNSEGPARVVWRYLENPVNVTRSGDTLTWSFTVPDAGFTISDIRYIGYHLYYFQDSEDNRTYDQATFVAENGVLTYLNTGRVENLGFLISNETYHSLYR